MKEQEGQHLEFKQNWNDSAKKSAVAFANSDGGRILVGVADDGETLGVSDIDDCMLRIMQSISNGIKPDLVHFVNLYTQERDGKPVVVVDVQRGTERPYYLSDKGIRPAGVYVRLGAGSIPSTDSSILNMIKESSDYSFEESRSVVQDLTFDAAEHIFSDAHVAFGESERRTLGLIDPNGLYTNLAWLLSDQCDASIKAAVFEGTTKSTFKSREEFKGCLFDQFIHTAQYISRYNSTRSTFGDDLRRHDERDYDSSVVREALLNLIIHRDYSIAGPALVSIFDDRMELVNFGGLLTGITVSDMMLGTSLQRNPKLAQIFYRLKWVEAYGTGIPKIISEYRNDDYQPRFEVSDNAFKLTLPSHNPIVRSYRAAIVEHKDDVPSGETQRRLSIIALAKRPGGTTRRGVQEATGMAQSTASNYLSALMKDGLITRKGSGRNVRYYAFDSD
jgi:ATP-dependent DNA helicase RecG